VTQQTIKIPPQERSLLMVSSTQPRSSLLHRLIPVIGLVLFGLYSNAQSTRLTLKDAIEYALTANQTVRKARLDVENSKYQIEEVRAAALPQISGSGALTYNPILQLSALPGDLAGQPGQTILVAFGQKWNTSAGLSLSQSLFDQAVFTGLKAAKSTEEFYRLNAQLSEEQIIEMVANAYYQLQVQKQKIQVLDSNHKSTSRVLQVLKGQFDNGLARKIDVDRMNVSLSNIEAQRQQLRNGIIQAANQLKFLMGMSIQAEIEVPEVAVSTIHPEILAESDSINVEERTEMQVLKQQSQLLNYQKKAYQAENYPTLGLTSNYTYQGLGNNFPLFKGASQGVNWFDFANVGLSLRVPIFKGGATRSRIKQADVSIRKLQEDMSNQNLSLNLEFENAKSRLSSSIIILNNQEANAELAQEVFANTQNNYNNGLATLTDLLDAESSLNQAQNNYSTALLDYKIAEIQLLKSKGKLRSLLN
jgi:outer membrane protein